MDFPYLKFLAGYERSNFDSSKFHPENQNHRKIEATHYGELAGTKKMDVSISRLLLEYCQQFSWAFWWIFNYSHFWDFWKTLFRSFSKVCDKVSKIENLRCTFSSFFRSRCRSVWIFDHRWHILVVNWLRKWAVFDFLKNSKISQNVLQKSITNKNGKNFVLVSMSSAFSIRSFCTPNFLSGPSRKGSNLMIAVDQKMIISDHLPPKVVVKYLLRFSITPSSLRSLGVNNDNIAILQLNHWT